MSDFLLLVKKIHSKKVKKILRKILLKNLQDIFIVSAPIVLIVILISIKITNEKTVEFINEYQLFSVPFSNFSASPYPRIKTDVPDLNTRAFIVVDDESKVVLLSKNTNSIFPMASTTKIMTALVALDYYKMDDVIEVEATEVLGVVVGFSKGEKVYFRDLLYALLLPSGNDAALALAQNYPGGEEEFVKQMNKKAKELHLLNTYFKDPTGLSEDNATTTVDLARLASVALKNTLFSEIVATKHATISNVDKTKNYSFANLNKLLGKDGINGVKTGFTDEAGEVLVTSRFDDGHTTLVVVMKSKNRFSDTQNLLSVLIGNIEYLTFSPFIIQSIRP